MQTHQAFQHILLASWRVSEQGKKSTDTPE